MSKKELDQLAVDLVEEQAAKAAAKKAARLAKKQAEVKTLDSFEAVGNLPDFAPELEKAHQANDYMLSVTKNNPKLNMAWANPEIAEALQDVDTPVELDLSTPDLDAQDQRIKMLENIVTDRYGAELAYKLMVASPEWSRVMNSIKMIDALREDRPNVVAHYEALSNDIKNREKARKQAELEKIKDKKLGGMRKLVKKHYDELETLGGWAALAADMPGANLEGLRAAIAKYLS